MTPGLVPAFGWVKRECDTAPRGVASAAAPATVTGEVAHSHWPHGAGKAGRPPEGLSTP
jgi:hypothetical protein